MNKSVMNKDEVNNIIMKSEDDYERLKDKAILYEEDMKALRIICNIKTKRIKDLMRRLEKRTNRIDKAVEFVEKWKYEDGDGSVFFDINTNPTELLDILKGEDKK